MPGAEAWYLVMRNSLRTFSTVFHFLGSILLLLGIILLLPVIVVMLDGEIWQGPETLLAFFVASATAMILGLFFKRVFPSAALGEVQAVLICALGWIFCSAIGAIPFVIALKASYLDGFFETMSGFTTTGMTMFTGLQRIPRSILFWRSFTQWLGGLGILTFFLTVTFGRRGAYRLFGAESHKIDIARPVPGLAHTLRILWTIYGGFTIFILVSLVLAGMTFFDSLCHSFTALSTGGFSPYDASIGQYRLMGHAHFVWIEYILILGMLMGGTNFLIHYRLFKGEGKALWDTSEMKYWWTFIAGFVVLILIERIIALDALGGLQPLNGLAFWRRLEDNVRQVFFQTVAIITTTGFGTRDIGSPFFGQVARQLFLVMMVIGGCVGSTGGGIKVLRVSILAKLIRREVFRLRTPPKAVSTVVLDGRPVPSNEVYRVAGLFFIWIAMLVFGGAVTALFSDYDGYSAFSGMFSALGNIGPCYLPVAKLGLLHPVIKIVYIFGMLAGRLEILPVLLLLNRKAWSS
jgi:trk system potassium uptake protein TrkH